MVIPASMSIIDSPTTVSVEAVLSSRLEPGAAVTMLTAGRTQDANL